MPGFTADFSQTTGPKQVSNGLHDATIKEAQPKLSNNNNPTIAIKWEITASGDEANIGRIVFDNATLTDAAFWRVAQLVQACELDTSELEGAEVDLGFAKKLAELLLGESIVIRTEITKGAWNKEKGEAYPDRATVKAYLPYGSRTTADTMLGTDEASGGDLPF